MELVQEMLIAFTLVGFQVHVLVVAGHVVLCWVLLVVGVFWWVLGDEDFGAAVALIACFGTYTQTRYLVISLSHLQS